MSNVKPVQHELPILVIDDDPTALRLVSSCLRHAGYECKTAPNALKGLDLLRDDEPVLVIVDRMMPGVDGIEFCRRIRRNTKIPFAYLIVLTACGETSVWFEALEAGADDFLTKPFDPEELVARVKVAHRVCAAHLSGVERALLHQQRESLANAVNAMETSLGIVVHELRNPLSSLRAIVELLLENVDRAETERDQLRLIHLEIQRMARLVDGLLTAARCQVGYPVRSWTEFDLSQLCRNAARLVNARSKSHNIAVKAQLPSSLMMRGSSDGVEQIVLNLISNAIMHTPPGVIDLHVQELRTSSGRVVEIKVSDRGRGMSNEALEKLRQTLDLDGSIVQAAMAIKGGFGLAICRAMAFAHGGTIHIDSSPNTGTTVVVRLDPNLKQPVITNSLSNRALAA